MSLPSPPQPLLASPKKQQKHGGACRGACAGLQHREQSQERGAHLPVQSSALCSQPRNAVRSTFYVETLWLRQSLFKLCI